MTHPAAEVLLRHAEGEQVPADAVGHIAACAECRAALAEIGRFETQLAAAAQLPAAERAALRATTARLLAPRVAQRRPWSRRFGVVALALAAVALATLTLWPRVHGLCDLAVNRYEPGNVVRADRLERFALTVHVDAPRWLALWQLDGAAAKRLLPHADPLLRWLGTTMPLAPGEHRVPGAEVLDFEFRAAAPPEALLFVASANELSPDDLAAVEHTIAATPRAQLAAAVQRRWPEARLVAFPGR